MPVAAEHARPAPTARRGPTPVWRQAWRRWSRRSCACTGRSSRRWPAGPPALAARPDRRPAPGRCRFFRRGRRPCSMSLLEEWERRGVRGPSRSPRPLGGRDEALFVVEGRDTAALTQGLDRLLGRLDGADHGIEADARAWFRDHPGSPNDSFAVAFVATIVPSCAAQIDWARSGLAGGTLRRRPSAIGSSSRRSRWAARAKSPSSIRDRATIIPAWAASWQCSGRKSCGGRTPRTSGCVASSWRRSSGMMRRRGPPTPAK